jgi:hypothetical protein
VKPIDWQLVWIWPALLAVTIAIIAVALHSAKSASYRDGWNEWVYANRPSLDPPSRQTFFEAGLQTDTCSELIKYVMPRNDDGNQFLQGCEAALDSWANRLMK